MKNIILVLGLALMFILPMVNADLIAPGTKYLDVNSVITNLNEYPDYVFVGVVRLGGGLRDLEIISDGRIGGRYKFETVSVYAIKKSDFNESLLNRSLIFQAGNEKGLFDEESEKLLSSLKMQKVIDKVVTSESASISSSADAKTYYYSVEMGKVKESYDKVVVERNNLIYLYIIIPVIALLIIIFVIYKRRK